MQNLGLLIYYSGFLSWKIHSFAETCEQLTKTNIYHSKGVSMKTRIKLFVIIAFMVLIGFIMTTCNTNGAVGIKEALETQNLTIAGKNDGNSTSIFLTDVSTEGNLLSGINTYTGWNWDTIPDYCEEMFSNFLKANPSIKFKDPSMMSIEFGRTSQAQALMDKSQYNILLRWHDWIFPAKEYDKLGTLSADAIAFNYNFMQWVNDQNFPWFNWEHISFFTTTDCRNAMNKYKNGDGKNACDAIGAEVSVSIHWDENYTLQQKSLYYQYQNDFWDALKKWAVSNGYVI